MALSNSTIADKRAFNKLVREAVAKELEKRKDDRPDAAVLTQSAFEPPKFSQVGYDPSDVWKFDKKNNPILEFQSAIEKGSLKLEVGGKKVEAKFSGIDFNIRDAKSGHRIKLEADLNQVRQIFIEGKDKEIFTPVLQEAQKRAHLAFIEAAETAQASSDGPERLTEDFGKVMIDDNRWGGLDTEYTPLGNGPFNQQLYIHDQQDMLAKAFEAYHHNPYAHRSIEIIVNFILGRGFSVNFADQNIQDEWDANFANFDLLGACNTWLRDQERQGEIFLRPIFDDFTGDLIDMVNMEASTILQIFHNPENINQVTGYYQQYQTPMQMFGTNANSFRYVVNTYFADEVIHSAINKTGAEIRGRSTLFSGFEYLKMKRDYDVAAANKAIAAACLVIDWSITGGPGDVQSFAASIPPFNFRKPITSIFHSANATVNTVASEAGQGKTNPADEMLLNGIAMAVGLNKSYLGGAPSTNRADVLAATEPTTKHIQQRQTVVFTPLLKQVIRKWIYRKMLLGRISFTTQMSSKQKLGAAVSHIRKGNFGGAISSLYSAMNGQIVNSPTDLSVHIKFPEVVKADLSQALQNIVLMGSAGYWSHKRCATLATQEWGENDTWEYSDEMRDIKELGVVPLPMAMGQTPSLDPSNPEAGVPGQTPPGTGNANRAVTGGPAPSGNSELAHNMRNNTAGNGASKVRAAVESNWPIWQFWNRGN